MAKPGHELEIGTTGVGKSTYTLFKVQQSFYANAPACVIDAKGDLYDQILWWLSETPEGQKVWKENQHRIRFLNPESKSGYLLAFNAISPIKEFTFDDPDLYSLVSNSITEFIRKLSNFGLGDAPRMQMILNAAIGTLVAGDNGKLTLAELPLLFVPTFHLEKSARGGVSYKQDTFNPIVLKLLDNIDHLGIRTFWENQWKTWTADSRRDFVNSSLTRIQDFLYDTKVLLTVCAQENAKLDFDELVNNGYWLFIRLPKAFLFDKGTSLLGNLIICNIFYACLRNPKRKFPYRLILDEAHLYTSGPLDQIFVMSRSYNLWLTLIVQYIDQLTTEKDGRIDFRLKQAVLADARHLTVFRSPVDAETLAQRIYPAMGRRIEKVYTNGEMEFTPLAVERAQNEALFRGLKYRQFIRFDSERGINPPIGYTPEVELGEIDRYKINLFEAKHLQVYGSPAIEIMREIEKRREKWGALLPKDKAPKSAPDPNYGGTP